MPRVLFLSNPHDESAKPMLGIANELLHKGEEVTFFGDAVYKEPIEEIGASFKSYSQTLTTFNVIDEDSKGQKSGLITALLEPMKFIDDILGQLRGIKFDYAIFSPAYPYANLITQALGISKSQIEVAV
ncbi:glycosyltransferase [Pedobacter sandarakinus]|uniref:hypothetical protein n=1 Tax=Pedobacter sandarakinus TaxID=353156 RepID=UPI0022454C0B|nr:hypothetical protein [Pedobacter sandarakinus]MCX2573613.1 hypothetical protein [Pedobacter sandarakinus]